MQIHINRDGQNYGPYSLDEARQYLASGNLTATDLAWFEGASGWMPLSQVPGIAPPAQAAAAQAAAAAPRVQRAVAPVSAVAASVDGYSYAGFWRRVVAYLVDGLLIGVLLTILVTLFTAGAVGSIAAGSPEAAAAAFGLVALINLASIIGMWLYFALMESSARQATLGKLAVGLVVTDADGQRIGFGRASGRFFGKILSGLLFAIGFLMAGFTARKQGLHDMLASTLVLNKDPADTRVPWWGWVLVVLFFVLPFISSILMAISIPAYNDYRVRAEVTQVIAGTASAKIAYGEYVAANRRLPESLEEIGIPSFAPAGSLELREGLIVATPTASASFAGGGTVALEPYQVAGGDLVWRCGNAPPPAGATDIAPGDAGASTSLGARYLPADCR